jgi:hypothetical protein
MPTVIEPRDTEANPQLVAPAAKEPELFAAEVAMEKTTSSFLPMLFVGALIMVVGGTIYYFVKGANSKLTKPVASAAINEILKSQGPATLKFSTGIITSSVNDKPKDPHYKALAKVGVLVVKPKSWNSIISTMTPEGQKLLESIKGVEKSQSGKEGIVTYRVPLAERILVDITSIQMINPHLARVEYTWQWKPNRLGREFDASAELVKGFSTWDRQTLIKDYGVDFFSAPPAKVSIVLMQTKDETWKPYVE